MATKKEKAQEQAEALEWLNSKMYLLTAPSSILKFETEYGKGQTDYITVTLYYQDGGRGYLLNITPWVGRALGYSFRKSNVRFQIAARGVQINNGYKVAYDLFRTLGIQQDIVNFEYR